MSKAHRSHQRLRRPAPLRQGRSEVQHRQLAALQAQQTRYCSRYAPLGLDVSQSDLTRGCTTNRGQAIARANSPAALASVGSDTTPRIVSSTRSKLPKLLGVDPCEPAGKRNGLLLHEADAMESAPLGSDPTSHNKSQTRQTSAHLSEKHLRLFTPRGALYKLGRL